MPQRQIRLVFSVNQHHQRMLSMSLPDCRPSPSSSAARPTTPANWLDSPPASLGDKLQLLALLRPGQIRVIEMVVDELIAQERMTREGPTDDDR